MVTRNMSISTTSPVRSPDSRLSPWSDFDMLATPLSLEQSRLQECGSNSPTYAISSFNNRPRGSWGDLGDFASGCSSADDTLSNCSASDSDCGSSCHGGHVLFAHADSMVQPTFQCAINSAELPGRAEALPVGSLPHSTLERGLNTLISAINFIFPAFYSYAEDDGIMQQLDSRELYLAAERDSMILVSVLGCH